MKPMNANELLAGLALARPVPITAVVTDSRKVQPGCIFVCFPGERVDGHDYAAKAYQAGAEYVIANHPVEGVPEDHLVICESSYLAMIRMASNYRTLFSPLISRGNYTADTIEDIRQLKNALNILEQSACEKDYKKQMKSRLFANDCSHNCYYITEN